MGEYDQVLVIIDDLLVRIVLCILLPGVIKGCAVAHLDRAVVPVVSVFVQFVSRHLFDLPHEDIHYIVSFVVFNLPYFFLKYVSYSIYLVSGVKLVIESFHLFVDLRLSVSVFFLLLFVFISRQHVLI